MVLLGDEDQLGVLPVGLHRPAHFIRAVCFDRAERADAGGLQFITSGSVFG
jgi:hypothetical protein